MRYESNKLSVRSKEEPDSAKPLRGHTVLITRTSEGNAEERKELEELGANVVELQTIRIAPPSSVGKLDSAISRFSEFDWVMFTSANGVRCFFDRFRKKGAKKQASLSAIRKDDKPKFGCVGPSTKRALENLGLKSSFLPKEFLTSSLAKDFVSSNDVKGKKILLARAERANREIALILREAGAMVYEAPVYRTIIVKNSLARESFEKLTDVTLTSPSTVEGLMKALAEKSIQLRHVRVHCIGPVTAKAAEERGLKVHSVPELHTIEGLVSSIALSKHETSENVTKLVDQNEEVRERTREKK